MTTDEVIRLAQEFAELVADRARANTAEMQDEGRKIRANFRFTAQTATGY